MITGRVGLFGTEEVCYCEFVWWELLGKYSVRNSVETKLRGTWNCLQWIFGWERDAPAMFVYEIASRQIREAQAYESIAAFEQNVSFHSTTNFEWTKHWFIMPFTPTSRYNTNCIWFFCYFQELLSIQKLPMLFVYFIASSSLHC